MIGAVRRVVRVLVRAWSAYARDAWVQREPDAWLNFPGQLACPFILRGEAFEAPQARAHLVMKLNQVGRRIATSEAFIEHVASRSSLTGESYRVCGPKLLEQHADAWLATAWFHLRTPTSPALTQECPQ